VAVPLPGLLGRGLRGVVAPGEQHVVLRLGIVVHRHMPAAGQAV
jgi:hypothetical protein